MARRDASAAFALLDQLLAVGGRQELNLDATNGRPAINGHPNPAAAGSRNAANGNPPQGGKEDPIRERSEPPLTAGAGRETRC
jgi:hypothetical protein